MDKIYNEQVESPEIYTPVAFLDDVGGRKIIARIGRSNEYIILQPPDYDVASAVRGEWVLDAAVGKQRFSLFEEPQTPIKK